MYKGSEEKWRDIKEYEGLYQISNYGNVKSLSYRRMGICKELAKIKNSNGYISASLFKKGKGKQYRIHRLVAIAFIDNSLNKPQVNYKNGNKKKKNVNNLKIKDIAWKYNVSYYAIWAIKKGITWKGIV